MSSDIRELRTEDDLEEVLSLSGSKPVMIFKHSTQCSVSASAHREFEAYAGEASARGVECARVLVVEERALSQEIAGALGVRHKSPQAILVLGRKAIWHDSHFGVTSSALEDAEKACS